MCIYTECTACDMVTGMWSERGGRPLGGLSFKPEQPFHTYSIDLLILQEGLRYLFFELRHVEHGQMCISGAFTKATTSATRAAIQCASRDPNRTTVV